MDPHCAFLATGLKSKARFLRSTIPGRVSQRTGVFTTLPAVRYAVGAVAIWSHFQHITELVNLNLTDSGYVMQALFQCRYKSEMDAKSWFLLGTLLGQLKG